MAKEMRIHAFISGRVQGVGYRFFAEREAVSLGLVGEVQNLWDRRVEVIAEGDEAVLLKFIEILKRGPSFSRVTSVDVDWSQPTGQYQDFTIT